MKKSFFDIKAIEYGISPLPKDPVVAMAYVPYQTGYPGKIYSPEQGLCQGTMFPELNKPFTPCKCGGADND